MPFGQHNNPYIHQGQKPTSNPAKKGTVGNPAQQETTKVVSQNPYGPGGPGGGAPVVKPPQQVQPPKLATTQTLPAYQMEGSPASTAAVSTATVPTTSTGTELPMFPHTGDARADYITSMQNLYDQYGQAWGGIEGGVESNQAALLRQMAAMNAGQGLGAHGGAAGASGRQAALNAANMMLEAKGQFEQDRLDKLFDVASGLKDIDLYREGLAHQKDMQQSGFGHEIDMQASQQQYGREILGIEQAFQQGVISQQIAHDLNVLGLQHANAMGILNDQQAHAVEMFGLEEALRRGLLDDEQAHQIEVLGIQNGYEQGLLDDQQLHELNLTLAQTGDEEDFPEDPPSDPYANQNINLKYTDSNGQEQTMYHPNEINQKLSQQLGWYEDVGWMDDSGKKYSLEQIKKDSSLLGRFAKWLANTDPGYGPNGEMIIRMALLGGL